MEGGNARFSRAFFVSPPSALHAALVVRLQYRESPHLNLGHPLVHIRAVTFEPFGDGESRGHPKVRGGGVDGGAATRRGRRWRARRGRFSAFNSALRARSGVSTPGDSSKEYKTSGSCQSVGSFA